MRSSFFISFLSAVILGAVFVTASHGAETETTSFKTPAQHAIIMDYETGLVLYEKAARVPIPPSSMSKMMTILLVFDKLKRGELSLEETFPVSEHAWKTGGAASGSSTMFLELGSRAKIADLLQGVIVQSGNDASIVLAEGLSGSERVFAQDMEKFAKKLGLDKAKFRNATGLPDPEHRISTYDLARLARITIRDYPDYYPLYAERSFTWNGIKQHNRNPFSDHRRL